MIKQINVVGAAILENGRVLAARRGPSMTLANYWEFPGGKIEAGEASATALRRELQEELGCTVAVGAHLETTNYDYPFGRVTLTVFWAEIEAGTPAVSEHSELRWCTPEELSTLDWAPADVPAAIRAIEQLDAVLKVQSGNDPLP